MASRSTIQSCAGPLSLSDKEWNFNTPSFNVTPPPLRGTPIEWRGGARRTPTGLKRVFGTC